MTPILEQLKDPAPRSGRVDTSGLGLVWNDDTIRVIARASRDDQPSRTIPLSEIIRVQLSQSVKTVSRGWWARLLGRPREQESILHAELRTRSGPRLRLQAQAPANLLHGLPHMDAGGATVPADALADLLQTVLASGARLVQMPATIAEEKAGEQSLGALEQLKGAGLANCFRVGSQVLYVPLATVADVEDREEHGNADKLEIINVAGHRVVIRKDLVDVGQRVVFYPPGTQIPREVAKSLEIGRYLDQDRVQAVDIRGELSEGLVLELTQVKELEQIGATVIGHVTTVDSVREVAKLKGWVRASGVLEGQRWDAVAAEGLVPGTLVLFIPAGTSLPRALIQSLEIEPLVTDEGGAEEDAIAVRLGFFDRAGGIAVPFVDGQQQPL